MLIATATLFTHFWQFFFVPPEPGVPWYHGQVWGNVVAVLPLALLAVAGFFWHKGVMDEAHEKIDKLAQAHDKHTEHLKAILDALDPDTDGGIADLHAKLDVIRDALDTHTPGGLKEIVDRLDGPEAPHTGVSVLRDDVDKDVPVKP